MSEPSPKPELPKAPPAPEAKLTPPIAPKEQPAAQTASAEKPTAAASGAARSTLKEIAAGKPVAEATKQMENTPSRETVTALLNEANLLLLELRDMRLLMTSLATQAADSPLGNEVRLDTLRSLQNIDIREFPPEQAAQVTVLQDKIKALQLPQAKPEESAVLPLIARYNETHPDSPVPPQVIDQIRTGKREAIGAVAQLLQSNDDLAALTWKELTGVDGFTTLRPTPGVMLDLAGIPKTEENMQKASEIFSTATGGMKEPPPAFKEQAMMGVMYGALAIMFVSQLATGGDQGGGGHR